MADFYPTTTYYRFSLAIISRLNHILTIRTLRLLQLIQMRYYLFISWRLDIPISQRISWLVDWCLNIPFRWLPIILKLSGLITKLAFGVICFLNQRKFWVYFVLRWELYFELTVRLDLGFKQLSKVSWYVCGIDKKVKQKTVVKSSRKLAQLLFINLWILKIETNFLFEILEVKLAFRKLFASKIADVPEITLKISLLLTFLRGEIDA